MNIIGLINSPALFIYITAYIIPYWLSSLFYYFIDVSSEVYTTLKIFKIQQEKDINYQKYSSAAKIVIRNQIIGLLFVPVSDLLIHLCGNDMSYIFPSLFELVSRIFLAICAMDIMFYTAHYYAHSQALYGKFHKIHHEWTSPVAVSAHYNHYAEHVVINFLIPSLSSIIAGCNFTTMWIYYLISTLVVTATHSGYWPANAVKHDNHHKYFNCEYGVFIMDYLMGTSRRI